MSNIEHELKQCSKCSLVLLVKHFSVNKKGNIYKCCDNCRNNVKPDLNIDLINKLRDEHINTIIQGMQGKIKYLGLIRLSNIPKVPLHGMKQLLKGTEKFVEHHEFSLIDSDTIVIHQWRVV